jgi:GNAT superfamily N-acetyltransferase
MKTRIEQIGTERLEQYAKIPIAFEVKSVLEVRLIRNGLGGMELHEKPVHPYLKDYDAVGESPADWPKEFDVSKWGFFLAKLGQQAVGGAAVALDTTGVFMLENRRDLSVLWDIRVSPEARGAGIALFRQAARWSRRQGCTQMKIETQNVNVPACRFYQRMGAQLGEIHRYGYAARPAVAHEVMLNWYLDLRDG